MVAKVKKTQQFQKTKKYIKKKNNLESNTCPVIAREQEFNIIKRYIKSFILSGTSSSLYITGVPGSGKTYIVKTVLDHLKVQFSFVNCAILKKRTEIYKKISENLNCYEENNNLQNLRNHFSNCNKLHIIVLDEIDFMYTKNEISLYNLFELPLVENSSVFLIAISNTLGCLSCKLESRIGKDKLNFKPYNSKQLMEIAKTILKAENIKIVDDKSLQLISKRVASGNGDIRRVINTIEMSTGMEINEVHDLMNTMQNFLLNKFICNMTFFHKLLIFLNKDSQNNILNLFDNLKTYCKLKNYECVDFIEFRDLVNDLEEFGILKCNGININLLFLNEEIEIAGKDDIIFQNFK